MREAEAKKTGSYERLVNLLVSVQRYEEAERWILEGVRGTNDSWKRSPNEYCIGMIGFLKINNGGTA